MTSFHDITDRLKKQDKTALQILYEQYGKKFYSYCIGRWNLSQDDAWEVVYRTLETLVLKAGNYDFTSQNDFDRFVYKVLINFLRQWYRRNNAKSHEIISFDASETDGSSHQFAKYLNGTSMRNFLDEDSVDSPELIMLQTALENLDEDDRDLLLLRAQNYSYREIAALLNIEDAQLKVKHHRAKQKLIDLLKELTTTEDHGK
jgi:RNA polymerase sigma factor (sigma-70 family)